MSRRRRRSALILAALLGGLGLGGWQLARSRLSASEVANRWSEGAAAARSGDWEAARKSWTACMLLSPDQPDCGAGLSLLSHADAAFDAGLIEKKDLQARLDIKARSVFLLARNRVSESVIPDPAPNSDSSEDDKRQAVKHWNEGIKYFQKNETDKARDEWLLCRQFDKGNPDCATGLKRLDNMYGGGL